MRFKKIIFLFVLPFVLFITSCSKTTNLNGTWKNIDSHIVGYDQFSLSDAPNIVIKNNTISIDGGNRYYKYEYEKSKNGIEYYSCINAAPTFYYDTNSKELVLCTYAEISNDEYANVYMTYKK